MPMNREAGFMGIFDQLSVDVKHDGDVIFCERKEWIGIEERSSA